MRSPKKKKKRSTKKVLQQDKRKRKGAKRLLTLSKKSPSKKKATKPHLPTPRMMKTLISIPSGMKERRGPRRVKEGGSRPKGTESSIWADPTGIIWKLSQKGARCESLCVAAS